MDPTALTQRQLDALREVTHIGCGAAATALSQLLGGRRVSLEVPLSRLVPRAELESALAAAAPRGLGVWLALRGEVEGRMLLAWAAPEAERLARLLRPGAPAEPLDQSALMEVGNIVASAWLTAVGRVSGLMLLPSVPTFVAGDAQALVAPLGPPLDGDRLLMLDTWLRVEAAAPLDGHVVVVPTLGTLPALFGALGL